MTAKKKKRKQKEIEAAIILLMSPLTFVSKVPGSVLPFPPLLSKESRQRNPRISSTFFRFFLVFASRKKRKLREGDNVCQLLILGVALSLSRSVLFSFFVLGGFVSRRPTPRGRERVVVW